MLGIGDDGMHIGIFKKFVGAQQQRMQQKTPFRSALRQGREQNRFCHSRNARKLPAVPKRQHGWPFGPLYCDYGSHIEVGKNFFANYNCNTRTDYRITAQPDIIPNGHFLAVLVGRIYLWQNGILN